MKIVVDNTEQNYIWGRSSDVGSQILIRSPPRPVPTPIQFKFHSPTKEDMARSKEILKNVLIPKILVQEALHSSGGKAASGGMISRRPLFSSEADVKIQRVLAFVNEAQGRLGDEMEKETNRLEGKIDKLEAEWEKGQRKAETHQVQIDQLSFSPEILSSSSPSSSSDDTSSSERRRVAPKAMRLSRLSSLRSSSVVLSPAMSPPKSSSILNPSSADFQPHALEISRKKRLLDICLSRLLSKVKGEGKTLQKMFQADYTILKFRRAENCVLGLVKTQRMVKRLESSICQLRDRLGHIA